MFARHFQCRVEIFFKTIVLDGILGKVKYHAIQDEFQLRGSPHIHSFLWILDAPVLHTNNTDEYVRFVDSIVKAFVPNEVTDPELFQLEHTKCIHIQAFAANTKVLSADTILENFSEKTQLLLPHCPVTYQMRLRTVFLVSVKEYCSK